MKAQEYIKARGIEVAPLDNASLGRLSVDAEFKFAAEELRDIQKVPALEMAEP